MAQLQGRKPYKTSKIIRPTLYYARLSSDDQKEEMVRQVAMLETFSAANG
jgi:predicted site-specific integrase-resolvase